MTRAGDGIEFAATAQANRLERVSEESAARCLDAADAANFLFN